MKFVIEDKVKSKKLNLMGTVIDKVQTAYDYDNIVVRYNDGLIQHYTENGEEIKGTGVDLVLLPNFKLDDAVQSILPNDEVVVRHFKCYSKYGDVIVFGKGKSSKTVEHGDLDETYPYFRFLTLNEDVPVLPELPPKEQFKKRTLNKSIELVVQSDVVDEEFSIHEDIVVNAYLGSPFIEGAILKVNSHTFSELYKVVVSNFIRGYQSDDCNISTELGGGILTFKGISFKAIHDIDENGFHLIYLPIRGFRTLKAVCPEYFSNI